MPQLYLRFNTYKKLELVLSLLEGKRSNRNRVGHSEWRVKLLVNAIHLIGESFALIARRYSNIRILPIPVDIFYLSVIEQ